MHRVAEKDTRLLSEQAIVGRTTVNNRRYLRRMLQEATLFQLILLVVPSYMETKIHIKDLFITRGALRNQMRSAKSKLPCLMHLGTLEVKRCKSLDRFLASIRKSIDVAEHLPFLKLSKELHLKCRGLAQEAIPASKVNLEEFFKVLAVVLAALAT
jgi:hypothetical protein